MLLYNMADTWFIAATVLGNGAGVADVLSASLAMVLFTRGLSKELNSAN